MLMSFYLFLFSHSLGHPFPSSSKTAPAGSELSLFGPVSGLVQFVEFGFCPVHLGSLKFGLCAGLAAIGWVRFAARPAHWRRWVGRPPPSFTTGTPPESFGAGGHISAAAGKPQFILDSFARPAFRGPTRSRPIKRGSLRRTQTTIFRAKSCEGLVC